MENNPKNIHKKKRKPIKKDTDSISELKEKIKQQKKALNKIIKSYSNKDSDL